jgi:hypothetical protein
MNAAAAGCVALATPASDYCGLRMSWDSLKFLGKRSARISSPTTQISTMKPEKVPIVVATC